MAAALTFVQLGRYGDIMNILPLWKHLHDQGHAINAITKAEFVPIYDGVSYVRPITTHFDPDQVHECVTVFSKQYSELCCCQVWKNPRNPEGDNFCLRQWALVDPKYIPLYQQLPLVFDRRNLEQEKHLLASLRLEPSRPTLLYNLTGVSSPFRERDKLEKAVHSQFRQHANIVNLSSLRANRIFDLLGVYEKATALLTIDTATLHLANACRLPTVALSRPNPFDQSQPRDFWRAHFHYGNYSIARILELLADTLGITAEKASCVRADK